MSFLENLNPAQRDAVIAHEGPVMIVAGAGSGKTRVLTYRIAYLVSVGVRPYEILALTFTNKAANEMKSRVVDLVGPRSQEVWMGTFHSTFARILRVEAEKIGFGRNFTIYDADDSLSLIKNVMASLGLSQQQFNPHAIRSRISLSKNELISPAEYGKRAADVFEEKTAKIFEQYEKKLRTNNAMDFDDLLTKPIELFERHPKSLEKYQHRFKHILIDEFQDTNRTQYVLIKMLAAHHRNLCVVGDDAQSIYAFRGADIRNILDFERDYPDCKLFRLEENYRSTKTILAAADSVIKNNHDQIEKNLWTRNPEGEQITVLDCEDEKDEAYQVVEEILRTSERGRLDFKEFAVLYRTNAQSRVLEEAFRKNTVPYTIVGGVEFYKRKEIKDVLAYLKVVANPNDDESLLRIINVPPRGIGETTTKRLRNYAVKSNRSLIEVLKSVIEVADISKGTREKIKELSAVLEKYEALKGKVSVSELARALVDELGILPAYKSEGTPEALNRWENVQELLSAITEFSSERPDASLSSFLEEVSLISDVDTWEDKSNAVTLMTLHSAKGLEFPVVFITGLEEGLFPLYPTEIDRIELEEERRLFYVGLTRTKRELFLSWARSRVRYGEVTFPVRSRFLDEVPSELTLVSRKGVRRRERGVFRRYTPSAEARESFEKMGREGLPSIELEFASADPTQHDGFEQSSRHGSLLRVGSIVEHETFGRGQVMGVSGRGETSKATVEFENYGRKNLMLKYANLRVV